MNRLLLLALSSIVGACGGAPDGVESIRLTGRVVLPETSDGVIHLIAFQSWSLEGELRHPLQRIETWEADGVEFERTINYPAKHGTGLIVYAWLDEDRDGVHCTPAVRTEPAGLAEATMINTTSAEVVIELTQPCAAADWFYPR